MNFLKRPMNSLIFLVYISEVFIVGLALWLFDPSLATLFKSNFRYLIGLAFIAVYGVLFARFITRKDVHLKKAWTIYIAMSLTVFLLFLPYLFV